MITFEDMWGKFSDKEYRGQYALSLLKRSVAFQIKTLRKKHCGSQALLAERSQLTQGVVSRAEDQDYGNLTFNTVGRIAAGLDVAFIGRFVPFSELTKFSLNLSEEEYASIPTFEEENRLVNNIENVRVLRIEPLIKNHIGGDPGNAGLTTGEPQYSRTDEYRQKEQEYGDSPWMLGKPPQSERGQQYGAANSFAR
jgi:transcriptional regulator with XRE-family HTH domain